MEFRTESNAINKESLEARKKELFDEILDLAENDKMCIMIKYGEKRKAIDGKPADGFAVIMGEPLDLIKNAYVLLKATGIPLNAALGMIQGIDVMESKFNNDGGTK